MRVEVDDRVVEVGNPSKVLFPEAGITKADIVTYYRDLAPVMLPHLRGRPVTMERYPDGIGVDGFYQKQASDHFPAWIRRETVPKEGGEVTHVLCDDAATLVYLADQACVTPHVWLSTVDHLEHPDRMVFDLDPPEGTDDPDPVREAARAVRDLLRELGVESRLMTTGSAGFHVVVPLHPDAEFDTVRGFARRCADVLADRHPDRLTTETRITDRRGRVFVDYLRNAYAQTTAAPYAVRARPGAPVAAPIDWEELTSTTPRSYSIGNLRRRLGQKEDPWTVDGIDQQRLSDAQRALDSQSPA